MRQKWPDWLSCLGTTQRLAAAALRSSFPTGRQSTRLCYRLSEESMAQRRFLPMSSVAFATKSNGPRICVGRVPDGGGRDSSFWQVRCQILSREYLAVFPPDDTQTDVPPASAVVLANAAKGILQEYQLPGHDPRGFIGRSGRDKNTPVARELPRGIYEVRNETSHCLVVHWTSCGNTQRVYLPVRKPEAYACVLRRAEALRRRGVAAETVRVNRIARRVHARLDLLFNCFCRIASAVRCGSVPPRNGRVLRKAAIG